MNILLVRPPFPDARNNKYNSIPLGLCKIAAWKKHVGDNVYYVNGMIPTDDISNVRMDEIYVTSMFTYWSSIVHDSANYWNRIYPDAKLYIGGIYATLMPEHVKQNVPNAEVIIGYHPIAEGFVPNYDILPIDNDDINNTQIIHMERGCIRRCFWCGVHIIEPELIYKDPLHSSDIYFNKDRKDVLLYDNNFLSHPQHKEILENLISYHKKDKFKFMATQGIDGRLLTEDVAKMMKEAGFYQLRFSWDHDGQEESVKRCIEYFENAGYKRKEMQIFCIINNNDPPEKIEDRYWKIYQIGCQIHSDRFRPLNATYDNYDGSKRNQTCDDYYINTEHGWTDMNIKGMIRMMSYINWCVRHDCLYVEGEGLQKGKLFNKGKSSMKLQAFGDIL